MEQTESFVSQPLGVLDSPMLKLNIALKTLKEISDLSVSQQYDHVLLLGLIRVKCEAAAFDIAELK